MAGGGAQGERVTAAALLIVGLAARFSGILAAPERVLQQFPTEDGYLMLQVARNLALGNGLSTAAGTLPTNGIQPLATWLWAGVFWLTGGDRLNGVAGVLLLELAIACAAALLLWRLGRRVLAGRPQANSAAALAAAAWFASPVALPHTMNCLESGTYVATLLAALLVWLGGRPELPRPWPRARQLFVGLLLGLAFLARNDAVFFILGVTLVHALAAPWPRRAAEAFVMGATSVVVALPWLAFNALRFGSIVPISGQAESLDVHFASSLHRIPPVLVEYLGVVVPIPRALELHAAAIALCTLALLLCLALAPTAWRRLRPVERELAGAIGIFAVGLVLFYGLAFGAAHFVNRYLFPLSPFLALLVVPFALSALRRLDTGRGLARGAAAAIVLALVVAAHVRFYRTALPHAHFQVVGWVEEHVPEDAWVAAVQTGTLGFFHDRTLNLDGKVNPEALAARRAHAIPRYVVERGVDYLADWAFMARWGETFPELAAHYEVVIEDPARNLGVLRRRDRQ